MVSFFALAATGMPLLFSEAAPRDRRRAHVLGAIGLSLGVALFLLILYAVLTWGTA